MFKNLLWNRRKVKLRYRKLRHKAIRLKIIIKVKKAYHSFKRVRLRKRSNSGLMILLIKRSMSRKRRYEER